MSATPHQRVYLQIASVVGSLALAAAVVKTAAAKHAKAK